jgi:hypothetical protein
LRPAARWHIGLRSSTVAAVKSALSATLAIMKRLATFTLGLGLSMLFAGSCAAASERELNVGMQTQQLCDARLLVALGRRLQLAHFVEPAGGQAPDDAAVVAAAACRPQPGNARVSIVAAAYLQPGVQDGKGLAIALLDVPSGQVLSLYQGVLNEDPAARIVAGSLWLDAAAYDLAPELRAFALDVTGVAGADCADGGAGARRTLYASQDHGIRPLLQDLSLSEWAYVQRGRSACADVGAPAQSIIEEFDASLGTATRVTNGYRDLVVTGRARRDVGAQAARPPFGFTLKFDGRSYPMGALRRAWEAWRS